MINSCLGLSAHQVTPVHGTQWRRHRGHWMSGPRHPSPLYRVCTEEHYCKGTHKLSHLFSHSHKIKQQKKQNSPNLEQKHSTVLFTGSKKFSMAPFVKSTQQWLLTCGPPQIVSEHDSAERGENMKGVPASSFLWQDWRINLSINQPNIKYNYKVFLLTKYWNTYRHQFHTCSILFALFN